MKLIKPIFSIMAVMCGYFGTEAHTQMREIMIPLLEKCKKIIPIIFDDIKGE